MFRYFAQRNTIINIFNNQRLKQLLIRSYSNKDNNEEFNTYLGLPNKPVGHKKRVTVKSWNDDEGAKKLLDECLMNVPQRSDVTIIGGGVIGSSIAYWLKKRFPKDFHVVVIEQDPTYCHASSALSVGGLRQQFSLEENIEMSLFGAEFIRNINNHLGIQGEPPVDVQFQPYGYLMLATDLSGEQLIENSKIQNALGARNIILSPNKLKEKFPWLNTDGISVGCFGLEKEGWFDPWSLLCAFKSKAMSLGVEYITAKAVGFEFDEYLLSSGDDSKSCKSIRKVKVELPNGIVESIKFAAVVIAAGASSQEIAEKAEIGLGEGILSVPLPVERRKRYVYCFHCPDGPGLNTPLTVDPTNTYFRRDGLANSYICGQQPQADEEPDTNNLEVDHNFFESRVWPVLANRVKSFECLKVKSSWAGYYEYNTFDQNGIIGRHPLYRNMFIATGFSGHGIQQAPAVGRAISELILDSRFCTLDLSRLGFERFITLEPMKEVNII
ncbi:PREDICTED: FAD-dependent oxidoreductase domain-containing protein 1 isoform X1 [Polistes dominula]|uniref:FAD-dependent oxidoreductase domain-containing protein 1 n=2 Tax=Polistes dominula TaxID=743375 RepID=A0ABM1I5U3_POLDO|nr:PREDICTED: FAD-dependent oxidoreductase domain-containing protein 1 isoform X1 [Polistes dominula]